MPDRGLTRYRRDHVGFVFQFYNLVPSLTARENMQLVTDVSPDPMHQPTLELVGLGKRIDHFFPSPMSGAPRRAQGCAGDCQATQDPALRSLNRRA